MVRSKVLRGLVVREIRCVSAICRYRATRICPIQEKKSNMKVDGESEERPPEPSSSLSKGRERSTFPRAFDEIRRESGDLVTALGSSRLRPGASTTRVFREQETVKIIRDAVHCSTLGNNDSTARKRA